MLRAPGTAAGSNARELAEGAGRQPNARLCGAVPNLGPERTAQDLQRHGGRYNEPGPDRKFLHLRPALGGSVGRAHLGGPANYAGLALAFGTCGQPLVPNYAAFPAEKPR